jgi:competence protein ComEC
MKNYPVLRIFFFYTCGIIIQQYINSDILSFCVIYFLTLLFYFINVKYPSHKNKLIISILINCSFILAGNYSSFICFAGHNFYSANIGKENKTSIYGTIETVFLKSKNGLRLEIQCDSASINNFILHRNVVLICNIKDVNFKKLDSIYSVVSPGNKIVALGTFIKGRTSRNPGEFNYNKYLHLYGTTGILNVYNSDDFNIINHNKYWFADCLFRIRKNIAAQLSLYHDSEAASLMKGLLLADRSEMDDDTKTEFVNAGVVHVLAVSGLNVEYILLLCIILLGRLNIFSKSFLTILCLVFFLLITGIQASVFRAVLMSTIVIITYITTRSTNVINSIALSAFILLTFYPFYLYDPGFQLSYAAVLSMAAIYPFFHTNIEKIKSKTLKITLQLIALSLSAQLGTIPFTLYYFGKLSVTSLAANLIVIPFIGVLVGIGIASLIASIISPFVALCYGNINSLLTRLLYLFIHLAGNESYSFIRIRNYSLYDSIVFYFFLFALIYFYIRFKNTVARLLVIPLLIADFIIISSIDNWDLLAKNELNVLMIDVGQGDSFLIRFPDGETALIDAGEASMNFDNGRKVILPLLNYLDIPEIDYAFVSHIDSDHYSGFVSLIRAGKIKKIYKPELDTALSKDLKFENYIRNRHIPVNHYNNSEIKIGNARLFVLNNKSIPFRKSNSNNDNSSLIKIIYGNTSFLFTGDLGKTAEQYYASLYSNSLKSDVLKVSHHGSKYCSTFNILNKIQPQFALISAGIKNKYNHPSAGVLARLRMFHTNILRTDKEGAVLLKSDGNTISRVKLNDI